MRNFVVCFLHTSGQMFLYQTPGRRPPHITGRVVNTATRGWVGVPNARAPFIFHDAVVSFVNRCPSRTRNLAASNLSFGRVFLRPILAQHLATKYVFRFFFQVWNIIIKICAHSERYRNLMAGIFEIPSFLATSRFPLLIASVLMVFF